MDITGICLNCFSRRGAYEVCPYCGYVAGTVPSEGYVLHPGMRLWGRYVIGTLLGFGGFGVTYRAWDTRLNTMVAIKELFPRNLVSRIPGETDVRVFSGEKRESYMAQLARFIDEAKNTAKFTGDAYIVNVLDYFEDNGTAYIVMEYLDGVTLKEYMVILGGRLPQRQAVAFVTALLKALSSIHGKGVIHRDISPDNIFVLRDGGIKVLDFGAARFAVKEGSDLTQSVVVKKGYAPPEQYRTNMKQGVWTDIYAAGATLYKMVTGVTPEESIERTEKDALKRPSQTVKALDASIDKTVMKAMALRPELRFKSADAMLAALENRTVVDFPEEELKKRNKRNGVLVALSVILVVAMASLVAWRASRPEQPMVEGPVMREAEIAPDTISILACVYPENYTEHTRERDLAQRLADVFMEQYPQHKVVVETYSYNSGADYYTMLSEMAPRFLTPDAPALFAIGLPDLDDADIPYEADLSPLFAALNADDYLFLAKYAQRAQERNNGAVHSVPMGFGTMLAHVHTQAAAARGLEPPREIDSWQQLIDWEREMPGTVELPPHQAADVLGRLMPEIAANQDLDTLEDKVAEYARMYRQGYFRPGAGNRVNPGSVQYNQMMVMFDYSWDRYARVDYNQLSVYQTAPLLTEGEIACSTNDSYSVSSHITENQQKLAMLFLRFMLSEYGQNILYIQNDSNMPLNKAALEQYVEINRGFSLFTGEYADRLKTGGSSIYFNNLYDLLDAEYPDEEAAEAAVRAHVREVYTDRWGL